MYRHRGNTTANPRRRPQPKLEQQAIYIADSIRARIAEGRGYDLSDYGIADKPEMVTLVTKHLNA